MSAYRKSQQLPFTIYCDGPDSILSPDSTYGSTFDDAARRYNDARADSPIESVETEALSRGDFEPAGDLTDQDDGFKTHFHRNVSNFTATSVSSLPSSALSSENEAHYTPAKGPRPSLHSPSVKRSQLGPGSLERLSPHRTFRASSPKKSASARASPRPRTRERQEDKDAAVFPLVLLHVTILPAVLPWSHQTVRKALPVGIRDDMALLRSRMSDMVMQRGVLVPHPQEEFELLEERILEALDLGPSTGGSCGVYESEDDLEARAGYSDLGMDRDDDDDDCCQTCGDASCFSRRLQKKWEVRVYAANGLMRAGAWAAAWSEMERVDVEILPYISYDLRKRLEEFEAGKDSIAEEGPEVENATLNTTQASAETPAVSTPVTTPVTSAVPEIVTTAVTANPPIVVVERESESATVAEPQYSMAPTETGPQHQINTSPRKPQKRSSHVGSDHSLPAVFRPKDVPLRILLANCIYLLAQDRRNMAILFLLVTVIFSTFQGLGALTPSSDVDMQFHMDNAGGIDLLQARVDGYDSWTISDDSAQYSIAVAELIEEHVDHLPESNIASTTDDGFSNGGGVAREDLLDDQPSHEGDSTESLGLIDEDVELTLVDADAPSQAAFPAPARLEIDEPEKGAVDTTEALNDTNSEPRGQDGYEDGAINDADASTTIPKDMASEDKDQVAHDEVENEKKVLEETTIENRDVDTVDNDGAAVEEDDHTLGRDEDTVSEPETPPENMTTKQENENVDDSLDYCKVMPSVLETTCLGQL